jgi:transposase
MPYRDYPASSTLLFGYDPERDLPKDHLARLVDRVVDEYVTTAPKAPGRGYPAFNPRLCLKVLIYGYATGLRSSRQLEKHCRESLPYLFLTRGDTPSYRTLCSARTGHDKELEECWIGLFAVAGNLGIRRVGRIDVDSTKIRANVSSDSILKRSEFGSFLEILKEIVAQAESQDFQEEAEGYSGQTQTGKSACARRCERASRVRWTQCRPT